MAAAMYWRRAAATKDGEARYAGFAIRPVRGMTRRTSGNLFADLPPALSAEVFQPLLERAGLRIERIVSHGQATPAGEWYDSEDEEWVVLLAGQASLRLEEDQHPVSLRPGDWIHLPAHCRHRVEWTDSGQPTIWLAVHCADNRKASRPAS